MKPQILALGAAPAIAGLAGAGTTLGASKIISKKTGKPAGTPASMAHIYTNDKLDKQAKKAVVKEITKEGYKDLAKMTGAAGIAAGAAAIATGCSNKVSGIVQKGISKSGELLSKVAVNGKDLKTIVKDTSVFKKLNALPTPAKAAIAAGAAVVALVAPTVNIVSAAKTGYIEGKHEAK